MAYTAKTWVNNSAPSVCAGNLNDLETGVADAHTTADRAVAKGVLQAKGDLFGALSASSPTRVVVGADDTVLVADSAQTHGLKWVQIGNAQVLAAAAIAYSKLNLAGSIVNADVAAGAAIAYSKLALAGSIVNADIASSASISAPKIAGFPADAAKFLRGDATWASPKAVGSFSAKKSAAQSVTSATWTKLQIDSEEWDVSGWYDPTTNYRYTPLVAGYYRFNGLLHFTTSLGDQTRVALQIYKNGSAYKYLHFDHQSGGDDTTMPSGTCVADANGSSDYFELWGFQQAGSDRTVGANTFFQGELIGTT